MSPPWPYRLLWGDGVDLGTAAFILATRADVPAEELRRRFPAHLKIGPVALRVAGEFPGLALEFRAIRA